MEGSTRPQFQHPAVNSNGFPSEQLTGNVKHKAQQGKHCFIHEKAQWTLACTLKRGQTITLSGAKVDR